MAQRRHVMVFVPSELHFARQIVRGARSWAIEHGNLSLTIGSVPHPDHLAIVQADGMICFAGDRSIEQAIVDRRLPAVNVSARSAESLLPRVITDNRHVGRLAAEHLLDRGYRQFGFIGVGDHYYSKMREEGFRDTLAEQGLDVWVAADNDTTTWIAKLPKPVGVLAATDERARRLLQECQDAGRMVPEEVAVVGVDNDDYVCESSAVELTSVDTNGRQVGYRAAELLESLMQGHPAPDAPVLVPCGEVAGRRSTDTMASRDPDVVLAARWIREHACKPLRVDMIMEHLTISRRTLELRFRREFGRSLHAEIRRQQIEQAKLMLAQTDLPVMEIALRTGFCDRNAFTRAFLKTTGVTPFSYRQRTPRSSRRTR